MGKTSAQKEGTRTDKKNRKGECQVRWERWRTKTLSDM